jgi:3-oxoacyl-[acyl-carrier protein] reductase
VRELAANGRQCIAVKGDMANPDDIDAVVATTVKQFGRIDVLVNCAGIGGNRPLGQMDAEFIRKILDTNVLGTVLTAKAALPHFASGGRIINISSGLAYRPIPGSSVYSASKAAVVALTHGLAKELGPKGITVNCVAPGVIETDMTTTILAERGDQILAMTPLARIGQPDDIAGIVAFLASPEAGWVTGRTIIADGGLT